jgi:hypothetical protein
MTTSIERLLKAARKFTVMDYVFFKVTLVSCGIILGAYFADFFLSYTFFLWVIFIFSFLWIGYRTLFKYLN